MSLKRPKTGKRSELVLLEGSKQNAVISEAMVDETLREIVRDFEVKSYEKTGIKLLTMFKSQR